MIDFAGFILNSPNGCALSRKLNLFRESEIGNRKNELGVAAGRVFYHTGRARSRGRALDQPESLVRFGGRAATLQQAAGRGAHR